MKIAKKVKKLANDYWNMLKKRDSKDDFIIKNVLLKPEEKETLLCLNDCEKAKEVIQKERYNSLHKGYGEGFEDGYYVGVVNCLKAIK